MFRFETITEDPMQRAAIELALEAGLAEIESLPAPFQEALGSPPWGSPRQSSGFFPWMEFATAEDLLSGRRPARSLAAVALRYPGRPLLLAVVAFDPEPHLVRLRTGEGVEALESELARIRGTQADVRVALATEGAHASIGWRLRGDDGRIGCWPAFPERYGLSAGRALSLPQLLETLCR